MESVSGVWVRDMRHPFYRGRAAVPRWIGWSRLTIRDRGLPRSPAFVFAMTSPVYDRGRRVAMAYRPVRRRIRDSWTTLKRWFQRAEPEAPEDPYAYEIGIAS